MQENLNLTKYKNKYIMKVRIWTIGKYEQNHDAYRWESRNT